VNLLIGTRRAGKAPTIPGMPGQIGSGRADNYVYRTDAGCHGACASVEPAEQQVCPDVKMKSQSSVG